MTKKIIYVLILLMFINTVQARNFKERTDFFIAKKLFHAKQLDKSELLLQILISTNHELNYYTKKSKILLALLYYKNNSIHAAKNIITNISHNYKQNKEHDTVLYFKSVIYFNINRNYIQKIIGIKRYQHDQAIPRQALATLKKIKNNIRYSKKIKNNIIIIKNQIALHKINIALYYFKKKAYIATIRRLDAQDQKLKTKNKYDYQINYLLLKSYNELFLDHISEKLFNYLKTNDSIKKSSNLLNQ